MQEFEAHLINQNLRTISLDEKVVRVRLRGEIEFVREAGTAAAFNRHAQIVCTVLFGRIALMRLAAEAVRVTSGAVVVLMANR